jgi:hypothetical protein
MLGIEVESQFSSHKVLVSKIEDFWAKAEVQAQQSAATLCSATVDSGWIGGRKRIKAIIL